MASASLATAMAVNAGVRLNERRAYRASRSMMSSTAKGVPNLLDETRFGNCRRHLVQATLEIEKVENSLGQWEAGDDPTAAPSMKSPAGWRRLRKNR